MDLAREAEDFYDVTIVTAESKNRFPSRQRANCVLNLALTPGKLIFDTG